MSECLECGETAPYLNPEYYGDRLCGQCLIAYWDNKITECHEELREAEEMTGLKSDEWPED